MTLAAYMHELSMASNIIDIAIQEAKKRNATSVFEVNLVVGKYSMLGLEQLRYCYDLLIKNTLLENSKLNMEHEDGKIHCDKCKYEGPIQLKDDPEYHIIFPTLVCPKCGKSAEIISGRDCYIKSLRVKT
ncbi:hydrogenase maturation nickel metallochaperone HypA [[Eubacterium] cellulosolvens]